MKFVIAGSIYCSWNWQIGWLRIFFRLVSCRYNALSTSYPYMRNIEKDNYSYFRSKYEAFATYQRSIDKHCEFVIYVMTSYRIVPDKSSASSLPAKLLSQENLCKTAHWNFPYAYFFYKANHWPSPTPFDTGCKRAVFTCHFFSSFE